MKNSFLNFVRIFGKLSEYSEYPRQKLPKEKFGSESVVLTNKNREYPLGSRICKHVNTKGTHAP